MNSKHRHILARVCAVTGFFVIFVSLMIGYPVIASVSILLFWASKELTEQP